MIGIEELLSRLAPLRRQDLMAWIEQELVVAEASAEVSGAGELGFSDEACGRVRLLCTLRYELEIDADALPVVMSLLYQVHDAQRRLRALAGAVAAQDQAVREAILVALRGPAPPS